MITKKVCQLLAIFHFRVIFFFSNVAWPFDIIGEAHVRYELNEMVTFGSDFIAMRIDDPGAGGMFSWAWVKVRYVADARVYYSHRTSTFLSLFHGERKSG